VDYIQQSARIVVPLLCQRFSPSSVLDVGCGVGDWLRAFSDNGVRTLLGLDGNWVPSSGLQIPETSFRVVDFYSELSSPGEFDLSICLEVVEHVSAEVARRLISVLCESSDLVFFSAAVPGQGGYKHINEQFQDYWFAEFELRGFLPYDCIRPLIWMDERVSWWYQQNCFIFANAAGKERHGLSQSMPITFMIHPSLYKLVRDPKNYSIKGMIKHVPHYLRRGWCKISG
jgi:SAM-dependent methyltransferase